MDTVTCRRRLLACVSATAIGINTIAPVALSAPSSDDKAAQFQASDTTHFSIAPTKTSPYATLPPPNTGGTPTFASDTSPPPFATVALAATGDYGLLPRDFRLLPPR